mmetsp:Transcript_13338/g.22670  ORF Transcript_13338/g.22670 Transcript_13338/m.22670 type:complete len:160 (+) Transcript_13338:747-1226(+)
MIYSKSHKTQFKVLWDPSLFALQFLFYFASIATYLLAEVYSVGEVWRTHNRSLQMGHGLQFIYVSLVYQYSMVIQQKVNPFRKSILFSLLLVNLNTFFMVSSGQPLLDEVFVLYLTNGVQLVAICLQSFHFVQEFKDILGIKLLVVKPIEQNSKKSKAA